MKRLEYCRKVRSAQARTKSPTQAVLVLSHFTRERQRLQQERVALEKRIQRIEARLGEITGSETRLLPVVAAGLHRMGSGASEPPVPRMPCAAEVTLRY
jgi:hypothetical protein